MWPELSTRPPGCTATIDSVSPPNRRGAPRLCVGLGLIDATSKAGGAADWAVSRMDDARTITVAGMMRRIRLRVVIHLDKAGPKAFFERNNRRRPDVLSRR